MILLPALFSPPTTLWMNNKRTIFFLLAVRIVVTEIADGRPQLLRSPKIHHWFHLADVLQSRPPRQRSRRCQKAAIRNWMLLQMPTADGSGHTFSKKNVANIVKEAEELVRTLPLVDSPDTSTITPVVVLNTVRINEIASKSA
jgi:hypothetical protein